MRVHITSRYGRETAGRLRVRLDRDKTRIMKGFKFKNIIFSCEHQPTQLGTEINRQHVNFATPTFSMKETVFSINLFDQSLNPYGNMLVSV